MKITIRFAGPDDATTIYRFIKELAVYEREPDAVKVVPETLAAQMRQKTPPFEALIAEEEGVPIGFALFFHSYSTWRGRRGLHLEDLYVTLDKRGKGAGGALLSALAQLAIERDCARLEWWVLNWNEPAIQFYTSLGAKPQTEWTGWRLTDAPLEALANVRGPYLINAD
jgi:GNAT superfamily N-acetyltransferase